MKPPTAPAPDGSGVDRSQAPTALQLAALVSIALFGAFLARIELAEYVFEDAYITYRYADNLASGNGFVFTPGERVLGTTTPLYGALLGVGHALGADIPATSSTLFAASLAAVALIGGGLLRRLGHPNAAVVFALLIVAGCTGVFGLWGLETPFIAALLFGSVAAAVGRRDVLAGALAALAFLTRYDAALFVIPLFAILWLRRGRVPLVSGLVATSIAVPWLVFAQLYFGSVMPNTLGAKAGDTALGTYLSGSLEQQLENLWRPLALLLGHEAWTANLYGTLNALLAGGILVAAIRLLRREPLLSLFVVHPFALWFGYAAIGPPLSFYWYFVPAVFGLLWLACAGWGELLGRLPARARLAAPLFAVVAAIAFLPAILAREKADLTGSFQYSGRVEAYTALGDWVIEHDLSDLQVITTEPGYFAFRTRNPVIDAAGLVTKGVVFHGSDGDRTTIEDLLEEHRPALVLTNLPFRAAGYALVQSAFPYKQLLLRSDVHEQRFETLRRGSAPTSLDSDRGALLHHPFELDIEPGNQAEWIERGGKLDHVGRLQPLQLEDGSPAGKYAYTSGFRRGIETPPFMLDFDRLTFRFFGSHPQHTRVQLIVEGRAVLEASGREQAEHAPLFPRLSWPVSQWRGHVARLRAVNTGPPPQWVALDAIRSVVDAKALVIEDFAGEDGYGERWVQTFGPEPRTLAELALRNGLHIGTAGYIAASEGLHGRQVLESRPFRIERTHLSCLFYDFGPRSSLLELLVDGGPVRMFAGEAAQAVLPVTWDVADLIGRDAVLRATDNHGNPDRWLGVRSLEQFDL